MVKKPSPSREALFESDSMSEVALSEKAEEEMMEEKRIDYKIIYAAYLFIVLAGVGTGYLLSRALSGKASVTSAAGTKVIKTDKVSGISDTQTFKDSAEGTLEKGGLDGEGTHKLIREGGPSQTAYLISSVVDLDEFVGKKVKVWGATIGAKKAAWLMDVGKVEMMQ